MELINKRKPYELGLRINGKLECVYQFATSNEREEFEKQTMPLRNGEMYEEHNCLF